MVEVDQWVLLIRARMLERVKFFGGSSRAWKLLGEALISDKYTSAECLDIFMRARTGETEVRGSELEKVLHVITTYQDDVVRYNQSRSGDYRFQNCTSPSWTNPHHIFLDGPEIQNLWGEVRSLAHATGMSQEDKIKNLRGIMHAFSHYISQLTTTNTMYYAMVEQKQEMRLYIEQIMGEDFI